MTSTSAKNHALIAISLALAACSPTKPPTDTLDAATRGVATARAAGADTYAPLELRFAEERYSAATAAMAKRDYDRAERAAAESLVNSELAVVKVRQSKARQAVDELRQQNEEAQHQLPPPVQDGEGS